MLNWNTIQEKAKALMQSAAPMKVRMDGLAEQAAQKCTELTGRETTAAEVKAVAVGVGAIALGAMALAVMQNMNSRASSGGGQWGGDFESQATKFFAENGGSLNFVTPHVDSEGQIYS